MNFDEFFNHALRRKPLLGVGFLGLLHRAYFGSVWAKNGPFHIKTSKELIASGLRPFVSRLRELWANYANYKQIALYIQ